MTASVLRLVPPSPKRTSPAAVVLAGLVFLTRTVICLLAAAELVHIAGL